MKTWKSSELETVPCDCCGSSEITREFPRGDNLRVVECLGCGLAYLNPRPRADLIPRFYSEEYFDGTAVARGEGGLNLALDGLTGFTSSQVDNPPRTVVLINSRFGGLVDKSVLEIGCATGDLLRELKLAGADVKGLEISEFAAQIARNRMLDVETGTIESYVSKGHAEFDFVIAFEVIEHVLSPTSFVECAAKLVRPGGYLILSTPNYACTRLLGRNWMGFKTSYEHLYFFSVDVLARMAAKCGISLKYWETSGSFGGTVSYKCFWSRYLSKLRTLSYLRRETGLANALTELVFWGGGRLLGKSMGARSYGAGHALVAVFQKR